MEIRVNREIREYTESMFFGLSLRQFVFSILACGIAAGIYLGFSPILGTETTSWLCIVAAFPFAVMGFLKYNGMTAEQFIAAWFRSTFLIHKALIFGNTNVYSLRLSSLSPELAAKSRPPKRRNYTSGRRSHKGRNRTKRREGADNQ